MQRNPAVKQMESHHVLLTGNVVGRYFVFFKILFANQKICLLFRRSVVS